MKIVIRNKIVQLSTEIKDWYLFKSKMDNTTVHFTVDGGGVDTYPITTKLKEQLGVYVTASYGHVFFKLDELKEEFFSVKG